MVASSRPPRIFPVSSAERSPDVCDKFIPLYHSAYYVLRRDPLCQLVLAERTALRFARISDIETTFLEIGEALEIVERARYALLVDTRAVALRNDEPYEAAVAQHRGKLAAGFAKLAVLTSSPAGRLQFLRFAREDGRSACVTEDPREAFASLGLRPHLL